MHGFALKNLLVGLTLVVLLTFGSGQALATHVHCGDTITQATTLDSDLTDCSGSGVVIGADNITLDLDGHAIDGDGAVDQYEAGIDNVAGHDGVTIKDGLVKEFWVNIKLGGVTPDDVPGSATGNLVRNLSVSEGSIVLFNSDANEIDSNTVTGSRIGIELFGSSFNVLRGNTVSENVDGISVANGGGNRIEENSALHNSGSGVVLEDSNSNEVAANLSSGNGSAGIAVAGQNNLVERNSVQGNVMGIRIGHSTHVRIDGNRVRKNSVSGNRYIGITLAGTHNPRNFYDPLVAPCRDNTVERNEVSSNGGGIELFYCEDNSVLRNRVVDNLGTGILVSNWWRFPSRSNLVARNVASRNIKIGEWQASGILIRSRTVLTRNVTDDNWAWGIDATPDDMYGRVNDVIDGGGNRAKGNGQSQQCQFVACK